MGENDKGNSALKPINEDKALKVVSKKKPKVCIFGFSYKKNTSDTRLSQSASIINHLAQEGIQVNVHDPKVSQLGFELEMEAQNFTIDKENTNIQFFGNDHKKAVEGCTSIIVLTEWDEFKKYDFS